MRPQCGAGAELAQDLKVAAQHVMPWREGIIHAPRKRLKPETPTTTQHLAAWP